MKKHRGAGHRGGRGNAGSGKRGDAKKPSFNTAKHFGKQGFTSKKSAEPVEAINLIELQAKIQDFISKGIAKQQKDIYTIDLDEAGISKLLGNGAVKLKLDIKVFQASSKAIDKVKAAGGKVETFMAQPDEEDDAEAEAVPAEEGSAEEAGEAQDSKDDAEEPAKEESGKEKPAKEE